MSQLDSLQAYSSEVTVKRDLPADSAGTVALAASGTTVRLAFTVAAGSKLSEYALNGSAWTLEGGAGVPVVAYPDANNVNKITVMKTSFDAP